MLPPSLHFLIGVLLVSLLVFLNAVGDVVTLLFLHQLFVIVIHLVAHSLHNFLHAGITSSYFFEPHLLFPLSSLHLCLDSFSFYLLEILVGDGSFPSVLFIVFYHFESSSLINSFLGSKALLVFGKIELKLPYSIFLLFLCSAFNYSFPIVRFSNHTFPHLFLLQHLSLEGRLLFALFGHLILSLF